MAVITRKKNTKKKSDPFVSIIIPCRNEEKFIENCLISILGQDYPKKSFEVLVVDGMSEDKTVQIAERIAKKNSSIKILENPRKFTPSGLNIGIKKSEGDIIIRMDCHAGYEKTYISKCVKYLEEYQADNVGGVIKTLPKNDTLSARAIALCLSHFFGAGNSTFRIGSKEPKEVDTVFGGCFKKEVFKKVGMFDERMIRSQDIEFNKRLKKAGGKIMLFPDIVACYYPKGDMIGFFKHNFQDGIWTTYPLKFGIKIFSWRHLIPLFFVSGLIGLFLLSFFFPFFFFIFKFVVCLYLLASFYFSFKISLREKDKKLFSIIPIAFACRHIGYGLGSLWGLCRLSLNKKQ